jgi:unsaturated chondroitin disaccharide hydrolase
MKINQNIKIEDLSDKLANFWKLSGEKIKNIEDNWKPEDGSPVFTVKGKYSSQGWTEWTQGFQFGSSLLQFDATGDEEFLEIGRERTKAVMAPHLTHIGVHDHGFNNLSTYGNLWRLMNEGKVKEDAEERRFYELAIKLSGAVQASRWSKTIDGGGYIYSFNGPQSLFADTMRSVRILMVSHVLGHSLYGEADEKINLLQRGIEHMKSNSKYNVYYGEGRDHYDIRGRTAHESVFNTNNGQYRCPNSQQGYSPFSTWTRGLAWCMTGYAEELEFFDVLDDSEFSGGDSKKELEEMMLKGAKATCDFFIDWTASDGIPYWDTGCPGLEHMGDYRNNPSQPYNDYEPIDSSAASIGVQGLLRLGHYLKGKGQEEEGNRYWQAGLSTMETLLSEKYLSHDPEHQGLILHSVYHQPNGWDHIPEGSKVPAGESSMWGDYHAREAALYLHKLLKDEEYHSFFSHKKFFKRS